MNRWIANALGSVSIGAVCILGWTSYQVGSAVKENRANIRMAVSNSKTGLADVFAESRDVTIALLKPCKPGKPESCGLIPGVQQVAANTGSVTVAVRDQLDQTQPLIRNAAAAVSSMSDHLNKTADAATLATLQARADLETLNGSLLQFQPLLTAYTRSGDDLNAILERKTITQSIDNFASITGSAAGILSDGKKVTDKATADYLDPKPWWKKIGRYAGDTYDYGALFARHTP